MAAGLHPDPVAEPIQHSHKPPSWILRGPTSKERIGQKREGNKEGGAEGKMEKRGREEKGGEERGEEGEERRDGRLHGAPIEIVESRRLCSDQHWLYVFEKRSLHTDWLVMIFVSCDRFSGSVASWNSSMSLTSSGHHHRRRGCQSGLLHLRNGCVVLLVCLIDSDGGVRPVRLPARNSWATSAAHCRCHPAGHVVVL